MSGLERVSITVDADLLARFDDLLAASGLSNRSEGFRDLIRSRLVEEDVGQGTDSAAATVTLVYDHGRLDVADRLVAAQHEYHDLVLSTMHVHLDDHLCLEVVALRGRAVDLRRVANLLIGMKGVEHGKLVMTALPA